MTLAPASVVLALALCTAAWLFARRLRRRSAEAPPALEPIREPPLSVHDKPTIEFSAYVEQLRQCADNDATTSTFVMFEDEKSTAKHHLDEGMIEQLRGPQSGLVALLRDPLKTVEFSSVQIDTASTGLPRPSARASARARELVAPRKRQA